MNVIWFLQFVSRKSVPCCAKSQFAIHVLMHLFTLRIKTTVTNKKHIVDWLLCSSSYTYNHVFLLHITFILLELSSLLTIVWCSLHLGVQRKSAWGSVSLQGQKSFNTWPLEFTDVVTFLVWTHYIPKNCFDVVFSMTLEHNFRLN